MSTHCHLLINSAQALPGDSQTFNSIFSYIFFSAGKIACDSGLMYTAFWLSRAFYPFIFFSLWLTNVKPCMMKLLAPMLMRIYFERASCFYSVFCCCCQTQMLYAPVSAADAKVYVLWVYSFKQYFGCYRNKCTGIWSHVPHDKCSWFTHLRFHLHKIKLANADSRPIMSATIKTAATMDRELAKKNVCVCVCQFKQSHCENNTIQLDTHSRNLIARQS